MKKLLSGAILLLGLSIPQAHGQTYFRPNTNPYMRPPLSPYFNYYYGTPNPFGPGAGGGPGVPGFGGGVPGAGLGVPGAGVLYPDQTGRTTFTGSGQDGNQNITGHPTRFFSYSQYFFNQGAGGIGTGYNTVPGSIGTSPSSPSGTFAVVGGTGGGNLGVAPPRGRGNITRPRTGGR